MTKFKAGDEVLVDLGGIDFDIDREKVFWTAQNLDGPCKTVGIR